MSVILYLLVLLYDHIVSKLLWSCCTTSLRFVIGLKELMPLNLNQSDQTQN